MTFPSDPGPSSPGNRSPLRLARLIGGGVLAVLGVISLIVMLTQLGNPRSALVSLLFGLFFLVLGVMLLRKFTSWKLAGPGAAALLITGAAISPPAESGEPADTAAPLLATTTAPAPTSPAATTPTSTPESTAAETEPEATQTTEPEATETEVREAAPRHTPTTRRPAPQTTRTQEAPAYTPAPAPNGGSVYYANCDAARAAGAAPILAGEPGYRPALDRNKDGVACENS